MIPDLSHLPDRLRQDIHAATPAQLRAYLECEADSGSLFDYAAWDAYTTAHGCDALDDEVGEWLEHLEYHAAAAQACFDAAARTRAEAKA